MATAKKRINISLSPETEKVLEKIAKRDNVPQATKAVYLVEKALEIEEDQMWAEIAKERDQKNSKFMDHKKAWV